MEGLLFAFHLEGSDLNWKAHLLLVMSIFAAAAVILAELQFPQSALLGILRAQLVMLQGIWFMQIAKLLFEGARRSCLLCHVAPGIRCCPDSLAVLISRSTSQADVQMLVALLQSAAMRLVLCLKALLCGSPQSFGGSRHTAWVQWRAEAFHSVAVPSGCPA